MERAHEGDFFKIGGTLPADAPSYVVRSADERFVAVLQEGEFCYLLNSRQMGKSSLCAHARQQLEQRGIRIVYLELSEIGGSNVDAATWYATLLNRIGRELGLHREFAQFRREHSDLSPVFWLFRALEEIALTRIDAPIVFILDEIDSVRSLAFSTDEFFGALRSLYNRRVSEPQLRRLTFCFVGSATPADLVTDTRLSPFNIGQQIDLRDFTRTEVTPLAAGISSDNRDGVALLERIFHWTNGHPFLTQSVCARVAETTSIRTANDIDQLIAEMFFTTSARRGNVHLADVANRMLTRKTGEIDPADDAQKASILDLYEQVLRGKRVPDDETNPLVALLKLSGSVRVERGNLQIRNRIYERVFGKEWIAESRPDAERRRQKEAYWRGVIKTSIVSSIVFVLMGVLSVYAFIQKSRADVNATASRANEVRALHEEERSKLLALRLVAMAKELKTTKSHQKREDTYIKMTQLVGDDSISSTTPSLTQFVASDVEGVWSGNIGKHTDLIISFQAIKGPNFEGTLSDSGYMLHLKGYIYPNGLIKLREIKVEDQAVEMTETTRPNEETSVTAVESAPPEAVNIEASPTSDLKSFPIWHLVKATGRINRDANRISGSGASSKGRFSFSFHRS